MNRRKSSEIHAAARGALIEAAPLVRFETFIQAIRDSGYKGPAAALAELVDNAIEANARHIAIELLTEAAGHAVSQIRITDDGTGMTPAILQVALQFGGSSRFNSRESLGRYGMGLPCSALSIAERVDVWTWRSPRTLWWSYLDVSEISRKGLSGVPAPSGEPSEKNRGSSASGTWIELSRCDRLDPAKPAPLQKLLVAELGRIFRHLIVAGIVITVNDTRVEPLDPLFVLGEGKWAKGQPFGPPLTFPIRMPASGRTSEVSVLFSELPVKQWFNLPNKTKRQLGISTGAGVSVIRAGREVDYGWFFMGRKRRENYDDWWRCEVHYEPLLDELFGLTHTKQRIRPSAALEQILTPEIEAIARNLNARVRNAFARLKIQDRLLPSERRAKEADVLIDPPSLFLDRLNARSGRDSADGEILAGLQYSLVPKPLKTAAMFEAAIRGGTVNVQLNTRHVFYERIYQRIKSQKSLQSCDALTLLELLMLAYSRAEVSVSSATAGRYAAKLRLAWGEVLTSFLG